MNVTRTLQIAALSLLLLPALTATAASSGTFEEQLTAPDGMVLEVGTGSGSIEISAGPGRNVTIVGTVKVNRKSFWRGSADSDEILQAVLDNPPRTGSTIGSSYSPKRVFSAMTISWPDCPAPSEHS